MSAFVYRQGALHGEAVDLAAIAAAIGTPFYAYSANAIRAAYRAYAAAFAPLGAEICYALKANDNLAVVAVLAREGSGADVVSEGELRRALAAGIPARRIVFSGVGKTESEIAFALDCAVAQINVESAPELDAVARIARAKAKRAPVALRVNPDIDAGTHAKITTGTAENKFGIAFEDAPALYRRAAAMPELALKGLAVHIGSQLVDLAPYRAAFGRLAALARAILAEGLALERLDLGGGLGIRYAGEAPPTVASYARLVAECVGSLGCALTLEPGRSIVGEAGVLVGRVLYVKDGATRRFVIVDAAMNDLIRPALYDAHHDILPLREAPGAARARADIVGPVCESSDTFARARDLPPLEAGDLLAFASAGAYGAVMASTYNSRLLVPEVLIDGDRFALVRPRMTYAEMLARDRIPDWLAVDPGDDSARA